MVAYLADAVNDYPLCDPGHTQDRLASDHPYKAMWTSIDAFATKHGIDDLCDLELMDLFNKAIANGFTDSSGTVIATPQNIRSCVQKWRMNGWFRYENQRDGRRKVVYNAGKVVALIFGGSFI